MSDSNGSEPLSSVMATLGPSLGLRFLPRGISDPEGSASLSSENWNILLGFRLDVLSNLCTGEDQGEWSLVLLDRDRLDSR